MNEQRRNFLKFFRKVPGVRPIERGISQLSHMDQKRRNILKLALFGMGAFVLGKIFGPGLRFFSSDIAVNEHFFENFRVVERDGILGFYDRFGNEILVLEKD